MKKKFILKVLLVTLIAEFTMHQTMAQLNCDGVTNMYGIFIDRARSNGNTYISPISFSTGVPGTALAPGVFTLPYAGTSGGSNAYGSTTLGTQAFTNRVFYMTGDYNVKDIWGLNATTSGTKVKIRDDMGTAVNPYWFVKMAVAQDGYVYSLSTKRISPLSDTVNGDTKLIRFNACLTANCAVTEVMARIPKSSFNPYDLYNGDIAFDATGDMYIFGSKLNPLTNKYVKAGIYRIKKADIPLIPGTTNIPMTKMGDIPAMDSVSITGVAFDGSGNFYLSATDTVQKNRTHIFRGSIIGAETSVNKIYENIIPNYILSDLASCAYPNMLLVDGASARLNGFNKGGSNALVWKVEGVNNVHRFSVERQLANETDYKNIFEVTASEFIKEYSFSDNLQQQGSPSSNYRIKFAKKDGSVIYSNTIRINPTDKAKTKVIVTGNPFKQTLQFDLTTINPGTKQVNIFDSNGFLVLKADVQVVAGMNKIVLDKTSNLNKGIYVLQVYDDTNSEQFKIVKN